VNAGAIATLDAPPVNAAPQDMELVRHQAVVAAKGHEDRVVSRDDRLKQVYWLDLVKVTRWQAFVETTLSTPWVVLTLVFFYLVQSTGSWWWLIPGLLCSFYVFLTGLRQAHNAFHYSVGIPRLGCDLLMTWLSLVMTGSMHAVQFNHLHHHRTNGGDDDVEGFTAKLSWWQALLVGPYFPLKLHWFALKNARPAQKRWIHAELALGAVWGAVVIWLTLAFNQWWLAIYWGSMLLGQCGTGFFAVWTVHHGCHGTQFIARTQRGWLKNLISYQMFHHVEHHLFPAVPTCNWAKLGKRLDEAAPELRSMQVY
jgi:fatty acid desaturase